jgi:uncharacterized protein YjiS (DUF1127 family)
MLVSVIIHLTAELAKAVGLSIVRLYRSLDRSLTAIAVRRELNALPDFLLRDMGLTRSDVGHVARRWARRRGRGID